MENKYIVIIFKVALFEILNKEIKFQNDHQEIKDNIKN